MEKNNIDNAIDNCLQTIEDHRVQARRLLSYIFMTVLMFATVEIFNNLKSYYLSRNSHEKSFVASPVNIYANGAIKNDTLVVKNVVDQEYLKVMANLIATLDKNGTDENPDGYSMIIVYGMLILVFSVLTSFYRFHQKEISKYEQYLIGFQRIRIAGNNSKEGFETEVRTSLTKDAFTYEIKPLFSKDKKIESPIPGHPTSDLATHIVNKLFEKIDVKK